VLRGIFGSSDAASTTYVTLSIVLYADDADRAKDIAANKYFFRPLSTSTEVAKLHYKNTALLGVRGD